jgi:hypothetical protein
MSNPSIDEFLSAIPDGGQIPQNVRSDLISALWGISSFDSDWKDRLEHWFQFYAEETRSAAVLYKQDNTVESAVAPRSHDDIVNVIKFLKDNSDKARRSLKTSLWNSAALGLAVLDFEFSLSLVFQLMFMTAYRSVHTMKQIKGGQIFKPLWKEDESLKDFIFKIFPQNTLKAVDKPIQIQKLSVFQLRRFAKVEIRWTIYLSDHLTLQRTEKGKELYVFNHAGFLEMWSRSSNVNSFASILPPSLANETLRTFELLFPHNDKQSRAILTKEIKRRKLDPLLETEGVYQPYHDRPEDAVAPDDVDSLIEKFPYWSERLYNLWREADDPAPITRLGWWSESKRNPRFTYWAGVVALSFAVFFGVVATILSAMQVWISYCAWRSTSYCGVKQQTSGQ